MNYLKKYGWFLLFILHFCIYYSEGFEPCDLAIICGLMNGVDVIHEVPEYCTAVAMSDKTPEKLKAVNNIKKDLPLVLIDNSLNYGDMGQMIAKGAAAYLDGVVKSGVDVIAFDNLYDNGQNAIDEKRNQELLTFLTEARKLHPNMLFGLVVPVDAQVTKHNFNIDLLDGVVDFYLIKSIEYRPCDHHDHQKDMAIRVEAADMVKTIDDYDHANVKKCKLIYTIEIIVNSVSKKFGSKTSREDMSYSTLCEKSMSIHRKYCYDPLKNLFDKARLRMSNDLIGLYVKDIEMDDCRGTCNCVASFNKSPNFPALRVLFLASEEEDQPFDVYQCVTGSFPVIKN